MIDAYISVRSRASLEQEGAHHVWRWQAERETGDDGAQCQLYFAEELKSCCCCPHNPRRTPHSGQSVLHRALPLPTRFVFVLASTVDGQ